MSVLTEQQVLALMGLKGDEDSVEPVADLLISLGYPDVAKELLSRWDAAHPEEEHVF